MYLRFMKKFFTPCNIIQPNPFRYVARTVYYLDYTHFMKIVNGAGGFPDKKVRGGTTVQLRCALFSRAMDKSASESGRRENHR